SLLRTFRWEWGLLALVLFLATFPSPGNFRWSFRWLPLFFLVLALLAAHALALLRAGVSPQPGGEGGAETAPAGVGRPLPRLRLWAALLIFAVWVRAILVGLDSTATTPWLGLELWGVCVLWYLVEKFSPPAARWRFWMPSAVVALTCWITYANVGPFC